MSQDRLPETEAKDVRLVRYYLPADRQARKGSNPGAQPNAMDLTTRVPRKRDPWGCGVARRILRASARFDTGAK